MSEVLKLEEGDPESMFGDKTSSAKDFPRPDRSGGPDLHALDGRPAKDGTVVSSPYEGLIPARLCEESPDALGSGSIGQQYADTGVGPAYVRSKSTRNSGFPDRLRRFVHTLKGTPKVRSPL